MKTSMIIIDLWLYIERITPFKAIFDIDRYKFRNKKIEL